MIYVQNLIFWRFDIYSPYILAGCVIYTLPYVAKDSTSVLQIYFLVGMSFKIIIVVILVHNNNNNNNNNNDNNNNNNNNNNKDLVPLNVMFHALMGRFQLELF